MHQHLHWHYSVTDVYQYCHTDVTAMSHRLNTSVPALLLRCNTNKLAALLNHWPALSQLTPVEEKCIICSIFPMDKMNFGYGDGENGVGGKGWSSTPTKRQFLTERGWGLSSSKYYHEHLVICIARELPVPWNWIFNCRMTVTHFIFQKPWKCRHDQLINIIFWSASHRALSWL